MATNQIQSLYNTKIIDINSKIDERNTFKHVNDNKRKPNAIL